MALRDIGALLVGLLVLFHTWGAWAIVTVEMEDRVEVFRGQTAQITCIFSSDDGSGGLMIQWYFVTRGRENQRIYYQDSTMKIIEQGTQFTDRISVNGTEATSPVVLTITDVKLEDELEFVCVIRGVTDGIAEGRTKLKVFETPEPPIIEGVQQGIFIDLSHPSKIATCTVKNGYPKPNIAWYKNRMPLQNKEGVIVKPRIITESTGLFTVESELSITVMKEDKDAEFYCEATYFVPGETRMTESNFINVTVYYPSTAVNVWVESPKGKIKEGDSIELHCQGNGNNPSSAFFIRQEEKDYNMENNILVMENVTRLHTGDYQCVSLDTDTFEEIIKNFSLSVNYLDPVVVMPKELIELAQGAELMATCNVNSSLPTQTVWLKDGNEFLKGDLLILKDATFNTAGRYTCVVTVPEISGMKTSGTLDVYVDSPPKITRPDNTEIEESLENTVELRCKVRGYPTPTVTWTTSDGKVLKPVNERETKEGLESEVSLKVTSDITAFCNASNEHGADSVTFNIKATTHTTTSATTTTPATTTSSTTTTISSISSTTVKGETALPPKKIKKETSGVIIAVIIICILLLAVLGSVLYFLYKKGKICGRSGKQDLTKEKSNKDNIVVEMKSDNTEEAVLLGVNGEKQRQNDQGGEYLDLQK